MRTFVLAILLAARIAHAQWDPEVPLTMTGGDIFGEGIAASGTTVHVIYGNTDVRYRRSSDDGATWSSERTLDSGVIHLTDPLVADGMDVWAIYLKNTRSVSDWCCARDVGDIYLLHSRDGGQTWDPPKQLTTAQSAFRVSIAYDAGTLHVVWMDYRANAWDTYYLRSRDRGTTWDAEKRIAQSAGTFGAERPQVAARGNGVHVTIWDDRGTNPPCMAGPTFTFSVCPDTFYIGSSDGGDTWGAEIPVSISGEAIAGRNDVAVAGASSVVINFNRAAQGTADANPHLFAVRSPDNGASWEPAVQLTNTGGSSDHGSIVGASRSVFLAWHDSRDGKLAIFYRHSTNEAMAWEPEERVSTPIVTDSSTPLLAVTADHVHALWLDARGGSYQIYYRRRARPVEPGGVGDDAGGGNPPAKSGCGCQSNSPSGLGLVLIVLVVLRRRHVACKR